MQQYAILVSPEVKGAYFKDVETVTRTELQSVLGFDEFEIRQLGGMIFYVISCPPERLTELARLSFVQGIFECGVSDQLLPIDADAAFALHEDFVFGAKYKGKTNERLTQLLINLGLSSIDYDDLRNVKLLDPMCGRGTTLLWAMRYGFNAKGVEQDAKALQDMRGALRRACKQHKQKHTLTEGYIGKAKKGTKGKFLEFQSAGSALRVITGDAAQLPSILKGERFDLLVSDIPYGVQHFTTEKTRNPIAVLEECASGWAEALKPGGALVIAYNRYQPKRKALINVFEKVGLVAQDIELPHRMSESIVRDVVIFKHA